MLPTWSKYGVAWLIKLFALTTDAGALNSVFCAASPKVRADEKKYDVS